MPLFRFDGKLGTIVYEGKRPLQFGLFSSTTQGAGLKVNRTDATFAYRVNADDAGAVLWAAGSVPDIKASQSRLLLTKNNTGGKIRAHGFMGQLKAYDAFWNNEVVSALYGRLEIVRSAASVVLGGYGVSAGVLGVVAASGTITVDTNHVLAGVAAIADFRATLTQTGQTAAFYAGKYDATNWSDGTTRTIWKTGLLIPSGACTLPIDVNGAAIGAAGRIAKLYGSCAAGNMTDGYGAVEIDLTLSGTLTGIVAAQSVWVNLTGTSADAAANMVCVQNNGIYVPASGTPMDSATAIIGMRMHYIAEGGGDPAALYLFSTNIFSNKLTAMFHVLAKDDLNWATGAASAGAGKIPLFRDISAGQTWYVSVYTA